MKRKQRTKEERNEIYWRMSRDYKSGKLRNLSNNQIAQVYDVTPPVVADWLKKIKSNQDRAGNPIMESVDGTKFVKGAGWSANRIIVYPVPSDWHSIYAVTSKNILTGESIKDVYDKCSADLKMILWRLLSFEIMENVDPDKFYYPQKRLSDEIAGQSIHLKISPGAYDVWANIPKTGTTSKSNWAVETVIKPFFLHIGLI